MIRYSLVCEEQHTFEVWFTNSADYDTQRKRKLVACPVCGSAKVDKALMAPQLGRGTRKDAASPMEAAQPVSESGSDEASPVMSSPEATELRAKLRELRDHLVENSDNVGVRFPDEARKMHYGEIEHRSIYGVASPEEAKEMHDEGIDFHPLPILPDDRN